MLCFGHAVIQPPEICRPNGNPLVQRASPFNCQPPNRASITPPGLFMNILPLPNGSMYTKSVVMMWVVSKSATPLFNDGLNELISTPVDACAVVPTPLLQLVQVRSVSDPMSI